MKEYIVMVENGMEVGYRQEIVRCKDCQHFDGIDCRVNDIVNIMNTDWFCADGEKKGENKNGEVQEKARCD